MDRDSLHRLGKLGKPWGHLGDLTLQLQGIEADELNASGARHLTTTFEQHLRR
ncbi:MAG: hypothetical protein IPK99_08045 [Flavobacteriales bacterium]|nr:hypothetical protein [Flavobacteriales bacterium]